MRRIREDHRARYEPVTICDLTGVRVIGARGDLYDEEGNLVSEDVEIAPFIRMTLEVGP
jgi:hypothetical protein